MDDVIFEEFKGTGNMELHLNREFAERRVFPAIDLHKSGTRREDKLLRSDELRVTYSIRKNYASTSALQLTDKVINTIEKTDSNEEFLEKFSKKKHS